MVDRRLILKVAGMLHYRMENAQHPKCATNAASEMQNNAMLFCAIVAARGATIAPIIRQYSVVTLEGHYRK